MTKEILRCAQNDKITFHRNMELLKMTYGRMIEPQHFLG